MPAIFSLPGISKHWSTDVWLLSQPEHTGKWPCHGGPHPPPHSPHFRRQKLFLGKSMPEEMNALLRKNIKRGGPSSMTSEGCKGLTDWKAGQLKPKLACRQKDLSYFQGEQHGVVDLKRYRLEMRVKLCSERRLHEHIRAILRTRTLTTLWEVEVRGESTVTPFGTMKQECSWVAKQSSICQEASISIGGNEA